jgi:hypothetical protein
VEEVDQYLDLKYREYPVIFRYKCRIAAAHQSHTLQQQQQQQQEEQLEAEVVKEQIQEAIDQFYSLVQEKVSNSSGEGDARGPQKKKRMKKKKKSVAKAKKREEEWGGRPQGTAHHRGVRSAERVLSHGCLLLVGRGGIPIEIALVCSCSSFIQITPPPLSGSLAPLLLSSPNNNSKIITAATADIGGGRSRRRGLSLPFFFLFVIKDNHSLRSPHWLRDRRRGGGRLLRFCWWGWCWSRCGGKGSGSWIELILWVTHLNHRLGPIVGKIWTLTDINPIGFIVIR